MVLGLGCVTMGTLTTRVLESKRERLLTILLLALAIPCSAQLGVVMGMLGSISLAATMVWGGVVMLILLSVGWLAAKLVPGERTQLLVELPPLRWPVLSNVLLKTLARLEWYIKEVVPLFLIGTAILFVLDKTSLLAVDIGTGQAVGYRMAGPAIGSERILPDGFPAPRLRRYRAVHHAAAGFAQSCSSYRGDGDDHFVHSLCRQCDDDQQGA